MNPTFLSPSLVKAANEVLKWAEEFLIPESKDLHRPRGSQSVCPFVNASIENDSFYMVCHPEINQYQYGEQAIEQIVVSYIPIFEELWPFEPKLKLTKALLVVFPNLPEGETRILDRVHANLKDSFVKAGLMIGQFHQHCDVPSVYNKNFMVSRSPIPLMAIRYMAIHDILFLSECEDWFHLYQARYGDRFNHIGGVENYNKHLVEYYLRAKKSSCDDLRALLIR
jgi:heptaprenyl diphosphate synthase